MVLSFTNASQAFSPMNSLFKVHIQWTEVKKFSHCFFLFKIFNYLDLSGQNILRNFRDVVSSTRNLGELGNLPQSQLRFDHVQMLGGALRDVGKE